MILNSFVHMQREERRNKMIIAAGFAFRKIAVQLVESSKHRPRGEGENQNLLLQKR
jgi:hypothetical protein